MVELRAEDSAELALLLLGEVGNDVDKPTYWNNELNNKSVYV